MKKLICILSIFSMMSCITVNQNDNKVELGNITAINSDKAEIMEVLNQQEKHWNNHNIDKYMEGYWHSDQLKFYGSNGLTMGWDQTLKNYKKAYPSAEYTGTLKFQIEDISPISSNAYSVMGKYNLKRKTGNSNGIFMVIMKRIKGKWKIISDTSC